MEIQAETQYEGLTVQALISGIFLLIQSDISPLQQLRRYQCTCSSVVVGDCYSCAFFLSSSRWIKLNDEKLFQQIRTAIEHSVRHSVRFLWCQTKPTDSRLAAAGFRRRGRLHRASGGMALSTANSYFI